MKKWRKSSSVQVAALPLKAYDTLSRIIVSDKRYSRALASVVDASELDSLAKALVAITVNAGAGQSLVHSLIEAEFSQNQETPDTILRLNSLASKVLGVFVKDIGKDFLLHFIKPTVDSLCMAGAPTLEINPAKIQEEDDDQKQAKVSQNAQLLAAHTKELLAALSSAEAMEQMPLGVKLAAAHIVYSCKEHGISEPRALIGGIVMLRLVNPSLATPESYGMLDSPPSPHARRSLVLLTKVLQNLSNGVQFGSKEPFMAVMNTYMADMSDLVQQFLMDVAAAGLAVEQNIAAADASDDWKAPPEEEMLRIHRVIYSHSSKLVAALQKESLSEGLRGESLLHRDRVFIDLLDDLGPPPLSAVGSSQSSVSRRSSVQETHRALEASFQGYMENSELVDTKDLTEAKFVFLGPGDRDGNPVVYVILSRIDLACLEDVDRILVHLFRVVANVTNERYSVVVDGSWASPDTVQGINSRINSAGQRFRRLFSDERRKNISRLLIVHPTHEVEHLVALCQSICSRKIKSKILVMHRWKRILEFIDSSHLILPEESKTFLCSMHFTHKIKSGVREPRFLMLSLDTLMNITSSGKNLKPHSIRSEIPFQDIVEIQRTDDPPAVSIRHLPGKEFVEKKGYFLKSRKHMKVVSYECRTDQERDDLFEDIQQCMTQCKSKNVGDAVFIGNKTGRHMKIRVERILKITHSGLLVLAGRNITKDITFASIQEVSCVGNNVILKFMGDSENPMVMDVAQQASSLCQQIQKGLDAHRLKSKILAEDAAAALAQSLANQQSLEYM